jgi:hypothetical protein
MRSFNCLACAVMLISAASNAAATPGPLDDAEVRAIMTSDHRHVRPVDGRVSGAIADGLRRSPTFANLVLAVNSSDVIVYIETVREMPPSLVGRLLIAPGSSGQRYLRIQISFVPCGNDLIAVIGHELQHALEVAGSPGVRDEKTLTALYRAIGHATRDDHYDTMAAQNAGRQVRLELS